MRALEQFSMNSVAKLETSIRDLFIVSMRHKKDLGDKSRFNKICSSLDTIGDTEYAFHEFNKLTTKFDTGILYLLTYGVLQAIFLQQDAIRNLGESLGVKVELPKELKEIRDLRNDAIGHPTKRGVNRRKGMFSFHHISRSTLSLHGFDMISTYSHSNEYHHRYVDLREVVKIQHACSLSIMKEIYEYIRKEENIHRKKYMNNKLKDIFDDSYPYLFEKVRESMREDGHREFGLTNFKLLINMIHELKEKLEERGEEDSIEYILDDIKYPLAEIKLFLQGGDNINQRTAEIFEFYVENKYEELIEIANEIDDKYKESI